MIRRKSVTVGAVFLTVAAAGAFSADVVITKEGIVHTGEVSRVDADGIFLTVPVGELKIFKADVARVDIAKPASYETAMAALKARKFSEAVSNLKPLVDRYGGLSAPWIEQAMLQLGEAYLGLGDFSSAKRIFENFARFYPGSPQAVGMDVKYARVLVEQKDYAKASESLKKFLEPWLKTHFLTDEQDAAVAEALVLQGDCQRATGSLNEALDSYLTVVTLFDTVEDRAVEAKYKAAQVFEQLGNWKRAKGSYQELLNEMPASEFTADARKRLAALAKDHPE